MPKLKTPMRHFWWFSNTVKVVYSHVKAKWLSRKSFSCMQGNFLWKFETLIQNFANDFFLCFLYRMAFRIERRIITLVSWPFPNSLPFLVVFYSFWLSSWPFMLKSKLNIQFTNSSANSSIWTMNGKLFVPLYLHIVQLFGAMASYK